jgi:hypothetical protein
MNNDPTRGIQAWANVPGMRSKWFWFDEQNARAGALCVFYSLADFNKVLSTNQTLQQMIDGSFSPAFKNFQMEHHEQLPGSEKTIDLQTWPKSQGGALKPEDFEDAWLLVPRFRFSNPQRQNNQSQFQ